MLDKFKTRAKRAGRQYGQRNVSPQKWYNLCFGLLNMVSNPTFLLYAPSSSHDVCALIFLFFPREESHDQQQKGRETKEKHKEWQPSTKSRRGHWLLMSQGWATTLSTQPPEWFWAAPCLAYNPSQTTSRQNEFHEKLIVWIFKHLKHFPSLNKITSIIKELVFYYGKLN